METVGEEKTKISYVYVALFAFTFMIPLRIVFLASEGRIDKDIALIVFVLQQLVAWFVSVCYFIPTSRIGGWLRSSKLRYLRRPGFLWVLATFATLLWELSKLNILG